MTIRWTRRAIVHLGKLRDFIARDKPSAAEDVVQRILRSVELLATQPEMGRAGRLLGTRELVVPGTPFVIPYCVRNGELILLAVFHGRQRWPVNLAPKERG